VPLTNYGCNSGMAVARHGSHRPVPERVLCVKGSRADFFVYTSRSLSNEALFRVWPAVWFVKIVRRGCCHGLF
jgi:hypothetical protein